MKNNLNVNCAVYDLDRLTANLAAIRQKIRVGVNVFAALKGDAYGHGAVPVARLLAREGVDTIMTGSYKEACAIKAAGIRLRTIMFAATAHDGIADIIRAGIVPTIVDYAGAQAAARAVVPVSDIFVKLDMGLGRIGVLEDDIEQFLDKLQAMPGIRVAGLYTHLPFATKTGLSWASKRYAAFDQLVGRLDRRDLLPVVTQAGASSSVETGLSDAANAVCVGHLLFGLSPFAEPGIGNLDTYQPVFSKLRSRLVQVVEKPSGSDIAIAGLFNIGRIRRIGIAPIGIAHGLQQPMPGSLPFVLVGGRRAPVLSLSLEHLTLNLDGVPAAIAGDEVVLLGSQADDRITLEQLAGWFGLSGTEMVSAICGRVPAYYTGGDSEEEGYA